jgi:hypothetical protein
MTIEEKAKYNAAKRHIKSKYAECVEMRNIDKDLLKGYIMGKEAAYLDCFRVMFYPDETMTAEML